MFEPTIINDINIDELITEAVVDEYWERGYWISPKLFDDEQLALLRQAHERLWSGDNDSIVPAAGRRPASGA